MTGRSRRLGGLGLAIVVTFSLSMPPARGAEQAASKKVEDMSAYIRQYLGDAAKAEKFQFAVISDTHIGSDAGAVRNMNALLADIAKTAKMDFVVNTGDVTESKGPQARQYMTIYRKHLGETKHVAVMGNHDGAGKPVMDGLYGIDCAGPAVNCNYSFDFGRWHFAIVHNGQRSMLDKINRDFLQADLTAAKDRPTLLFYHIHVMCPSPGQAHLSYMGEKRYAALALLNRFANLKGCFAGHDHAFWHGRYMGKNFFSTVGSWYQCGGTRNGWWWFAVDGETITVKRKQVGKPPEAMPAWEKFPAYPTAMTGAVAAHGRTEIPLFTERLTGAGYYWGTQGYATGPRGGIQPVAGEKMIWSMELARLGQGVLGCEDFKVAPGDRLAYWMYVPPGAEKWTYGVRPGGGWRGFEKLTDQNALPAYLNPAKAGVSPGNWLYREVPLGRTDRWFSTFTAAVPGRYGTWPTANLRSSWRLFLDEVKILRAGDKPAPDVAASGKVAAARLNSPKSVKADKIGAGYVVLTWKPVEGAHHYRVMRAQGDKRHFVGTAPAGRFVDFTVKPGRQYAYEVSAVSALLKPGPGAGVKVATAKADPAPAKVAGLRGALLPKRRFVFAGTWHTKPAVHIHWNGKSDLNDLSVRTYRVYRVADGKKTLFAETMGRYALIDGAKVGERFAVSAVSHASAEGPAAELTVTTTWNGPGEAFHLRTGAEDSVKAPAPATRPAASGRTDHRE